MDIQINEDEPESSIDRYVMDTVADGGEESDVFDVPPHWHKVRLSSTNFWKSVSTSRSNRH